MIGVDNSQEMLEAALAKKQMSGSEILYLCQDMRELDFYSTVGTVLSVCDSVNYLLEDEDVENRDTCSFIWENYYHEEERINEYDLTVFVKEEGEEACGQDSSGEGLFRRFTETHFQRGYTLKEMSGFVEKAGMQVVCALDADTHGDVTDCSERIYVVAREYRKQKGIKV